MNSYRNYLYGALKTENSFLNNTLNSLSQILLTYWRF